MKPNIEMHAPVEEVDLDPCDLYTDIGTLIVEGRLPGISDRGYGEGPHCQTLQGQKRHQCDPTSPECQKYDQIQKHMLLLLKNGIPMTIEVLFYPSCCAPSQSVDSTSYILLEQWTIHMLPRRVPDASISPRGLFQAVRSFLYFSQLCAWYSLSGGKLPQNVHCRICVPGEAFSSKFTSQPDCHIFPVANVGRNSAMKVLVKSHPRCGNIPEIPCHKCNEIKLPLKAKAIVQLPPVDDYVLDGILPAGGVAPRTGSPADSMLGESLLDPPNSLQMYPKRYQSPSRCGSPSIEVPEHLMFGSKSKKEPTPRRSRPQRRPVVERFLTKNFAQGSGNSPERGNSSSHQRADIPGDPRPLRHYEKKLTVTDIPPDIRALKQRMYESSTAYSVLEDSMDHEEMGRILERLRDRQTYGKCLHGSSIEAAKLSFYANINQNAFLKVNATCDQDCDNNTTTISKDFLVNKLGKSGPGPEEDPVPRRKALSDMVSGLKCIVNIKKYGDFIADDNEEEELNDEREVGEMSSEVEMLRLDDELEDEHMPIVPSAEKKAMFRRSLDSATSLVFHQRSGLPLTSSPAPTRKCGTTFDFDSTLTTVSAIKRALFVKKSPCDIEEQEKNAHFSTSAPASIFSSSLLGTFEESVLNGRLEPVSTVEGFTAEIGASGSFCPRHIKMPVTVFFYTLQDMDKVTSPYMGHINLKDKDYHVPKKGTVQVTLFNPHETVVKMFVVRYDLSDMPVNCQTFLRQRTLYMPADAREPYAQKWLRYLLHLRFMSSKSGRIYLHTDIRLIVFRKSDLDAATVHGQRPYELRTFSHTPLNPKYSPHTP